MCGRFVKTSPIKAIAEMFNAQPAEQPILEISPNYNVAPTQDVIIVNNRGVKQIVKCRWGFVPSWSKGLI